MTTEQITAAFAARAAVHHTDLGIEVHIVGIAHRNAGGCAKVLLDWDGSGALQWWADPADIEAIAA